MPSISARVSPASAIASSAALLMRSREEEPSCLPNAVSPTPVMKLISARLPVTSSFRDAPRGAFRDAPRGADPESRDSGFAAAQRPGMTAWNSSLHYLKDQLIRLRQAQNLFGNKAENELWADRGDAGDQGFAQVALDMKFLGVAEAAVSHHGLLAGLKAGFSGEIFRGIGRWTTWQALIVLPASRERHQPRRLQLHPVFCERMLDRLVLADRPVEHVAFLCVGGGTRKRDLAQSNRFGGDQDALRVHAMQNIFEAAAFVAKAILDRDFKVLEKKFVGVDGLAAHLLDLMNRDAAAIEIGIKQTQPLGRALYFLQRRGAGEEQNLFGDLRGGDPDFLTVDEVFVA